MIFLSLNIRGIGVEGKCGWVRKLKTENGVSVLALQETRTGNVGVSEMRRFWGTGDMETESVDARGRSGGLVTVWDPKKFSKCRVEVHRNFILVSGFLKDDDSKLNILNVYAPQKLQEKKNLWNLLLGVMRICQGMWCCLGDFNAVRYPEERKNSVFNYSVARDFNDFIDEAGLREFSMKGSKYTFLAGKGLGFKMSKIDRFLVCSEFFNKWPNACLRALPRYLSDHNPLLLTIDNKNYGSRPFRWYNSWVDKEGCSELISKTLKDFNMSGPPDLVLSKKLKLLRSVLRDWKSTLDGKEKEEMDCLKADLADLDKIGEDREFEEEEKWVWLECKQRIGELESANAKDLRQKSRVRWAMHGDDNTAFFHGVINGRKASNYIPGLMVNGVWISQPNQVKREVLKFFRSHFSEKVPDRPTLRTGNFKRVPEESAGFLVAPFTKEEVRDAVFDCGADKAPGPDGFNFRFVRKFWDVLEDDFFQIMSCFYNTGEMSRGCGSSFITLIPKIKDPLGLKDYRPITLVGLISKVISKVLAGRLKRIIGLVISEEQSGFLKDRNILDGPLVINELLSWIKRKGRRAFLLKIDFEKAYDNVSWKFLMSILEQMGFPGRWCMWVAGILKSARSSVLVNGSPTFEFQCEKGLRQGDPLSPFLFLVVMEALSGLLNKAILEEEFEGLKVGREGPLLTHLFYADDALIMGEWSRNNIEKMARILRIFYMCSGLKINIHKSSLFGLGTSSGEVNDVANLLGCQIGETPFDYLGIKVGANMNRCNNWRKVVEIFEGRLSSWKARLLSIGGRVTLIKAVLQSLPVYYFSLYKAPDKILKTLDGLMKRFLWAGSDSVKKIHWVAWERVTSPKKVGGLGITKLKDSNAALLSKWVWRFKRENNTLWKTFIIACHPSRHRWSFLPLSSRSSGCWAVIVRLGDKLKFGDRLFHGCFRGKVGDGHSIRFWLDHWVLDGPLKENFPSIFSIDTRKDCTVRDKWQGDSASGCWSVLGQNVLIPADCLADWDSLGSILSRFRVSDTADAWSWFGYGAAPFSVKAVKVLIGKHMIYGDWYRFRWVSWVPLKCNIHAWRSEMERLPTAIALSKRNVQVGDQVCVFCNFDYETSSHLFSGCGFSFAVWSAIGSWCGLNSIVAFDNRDLLELYKQAAGGKDGRNLVHGIVIIVFWVLWGARNDKVFHRKNPKVFEVVSSVKSLAFLWFKSRSRFKNLLWKDWVVNPLYML